MLSDSTNDKKFNAEPETRKYVKLSSAEEFMLSSKNYSRLTLPCNKFHVT